MLTAATGFALFAGIAPTGRARRTAAAIKTLLRAGGIVSTLRTSDQQWDDPNGWAPLQWIAARGLEACGHGELAHQVRTRWTDMVTRAHAQAGALKEKYNVDTGEAGSGGEYVAETGFGWTNAVTLDFLTTNR